MGWECTIASQIGLNFYFIEQSIAFITVNISTDIHIPDMVIDRAFGVIRH